MAPHPMIPVSMSLGSRDKDGQSNTEGGTAAINPAHPALNKPASAQHRKLFNDSAEALFSVNEAAVKVVAEAITANPVRTDRAPSQSRSCACGGGAHAITVSVIVSLACH